jgi:hypothetical protein
MTLISLVLRFSGVTRGKVPDDLDNPGSQVINLPAQRTMIVSRSASDALDML